MKVKIGNIKIKSKLNIGEVKSGIKNIFPELENLEITPMATEQNFKSNKYGYDNVKVNAIESEELNIIPSIETQVKEGIFNKVTVEAIEDLTEDLTRQTNVIQSQETTIDDIIEILQQKAFPSFEFQEKTVIPSVNEQEILPDDTYDGLSKVVIVGDEDLKAENIKEGTTIFGVEGVAKTTNAKITDASYLFYNGARLDNMNEFLKLCDWNLINKCQYMFYYCNTVDEIDTSNVDTSNVTTMSYMFGNCSQLTSLDLSNFNTSNVTTMSNMFSNCKELTKLDLSSFNTSNVIEMNSMFHNCRELTGLDLSNFDGSNVEIIGSIFGGCIKLSNLIFMDNLGKAYTQKTNNYSNYKLDLSSCSKLTHDSLMSVINKLYDLNLTYNVANGGTLYTQSLVLGSTNLAKLSADEIAIATNKGWTVS